MHIAVIKREDHQHSYRQILSSLRQIASYISLELLTHKSVKKLCYLIESNYEKYKSLKLIQVPIQKDHIHRIGAKFVIQMCFFMLSLKAIVKQKLVSIR